MHRRRRKQLHGPVHLLRVRSQRLLGVRRVAIALLLLRRCCRESQSLNPGDASKSSSSWPDPLLTLLPGLELEGTALVRRFESAGRNCGECQRQPLRVRVPLPWTALAHSAELSGRPQGHGPRSGQSRPHHRSDGPGRPRGRRRHHCRLCRRRRRTRLGGKSALEQRLCRRRAWLALRVNHLDDRDGILGYLAVLQHVYQCVESFVPSGRQIVSRM